MRRSTILATVMCCVLAVGLAACSSDSKSSDTSSSSKAGVTIKDLAFTVAPVSGGAKVTVKNEDSTTHTVTADDGSFNVSVDPNSEATFTAPSKAGSYAFHCNIHPTMKATLSVT